MPHHRRTCIECSAPFQSRQYSADFCSTRCRQQFNNRRLTRGALLYDLLMVQEQDPAASDRYSLDGRVSAAIEQFRREDAEAGRKRSYKRPSDIAASTMYLR